MINSIRFQVQIKKLFQAEELYKSGKDGWVESLNKTLLNKEDSKVMQLAFSSHEKDGQ